MSESVNITDSQILQPGFLSGEVVHHRFSPREHRFTNRMYWHLLSLNQVQDWSGQSLFRSLNRFNIYAIDNRDYVFCQSRSILEQISDYVTHQSGEVFSGEVLLMTHPRFMGIGFNSVSFYFCYRQQQLHAIVSEINNTPWGEKQLYFHDCRQQHNTDNHYDFSFDKCFHISPFVSMDIHYQWRFVVNASGVDVHMKLFKNDATLMYVGMKTSWLSADSGITITKPAQAWKMWLNIYYQAARLWLKKVPFYNHPNTE